MELPLTLHYFITTLTIKRFSSLYVCWNWIALIQDCVRVTSLLLRHTKLLMVSFSNYRWNFGTLSGNECDEHHWGCHVGGQDSPTHHPLSAFAKTSCGRSQIVFFLGHFFPTPLGFPPTWKKWLFQCSPTCQQSALLFLHVRGHARAQFDFFLIPFGSSQGLSLQAMTACSWERERERIKI